MDEKGLEEWQADYALGLGVPQVLMSVGPVCMGGGCSQLQDLGVEYVLSRLVNCSPEDRPVPIHR